MDDISNDNTPIVARLLMDMSHKRLSPWHIRGGIRVMLYREGIRLGLEEPVNCLLQGSQVFVCPAKFQSWPSEINHDEEAQESKNAQRR